MFMLIRLPAEPRSIQMFDFTHEMSEPTVITYKTCETKDYFEAVAIHRCMALATNLDQRIVMPARPPLEAVSSLDSDEDFLGMAPPPGMRCGL